MKKMKPELIALVIVVLAFIAFLVLPHGQTEGTITVFGIKLKVRGNNQPTTQPGLKIKDADAGGNIKLNDTTGKGIEGEKLKAAKDIEATSSSSNSPPKP